MNDDPDTGTDTDTGRRADTRADIQTDIQADTAAMNRSREDIARWLAQEGRSPRAHAAGSLLREVTARGWPGLVKLGAVACDAQLRPLARRHPWALLATAAVAGGALAATHPWRWLLRPALLGSVLTQVATAWVAGPASPPRR